MNLNEKYSIIEYVKYRRGKKGNYDALATKNFFDEELCKELLKNVDDIINVIQDIGEFFDFSLIFSNFGDELSDIQENLLTFLILKEVKNIDFIAKTAKNNIQPIIDKIYFKNENGDRHIFPKIIEILDVEQAIIFMNRHLNNLSDSQIEDCIQTLYKIKRYDVLSAIIMGNNRTREIFITNISQPFFYEIVEQLNLDDSFIANRQKYLKSILADPKKYDNNTLKDALCDYYFKEKFCNIMLDFKTINEALDSFKFNDCVSEIKIILNKYYSFFKDFDFKTEEEITKFVEEFNINKKLLDKMYEYSQRLFQDSIFRRVNTQFENVKKSVVKSASGNDVTMYNCPNEISKSQEIVMLISTIPVENSSEEFIEKFFGEENGELKFKRRSCSLISQSRLTSIFGSAKNRIIFGYSNLSDRRITSATLSDGQTDGNETRYGAKRKTRRCRFIDVQDFIEQTVGHNEISLEYSKESEYKINMPSYIVVIDREPNQIEIDIAGYMNIPIRIFDTIKYTQCSTNKDIDVEEQYDYIYFFKKPVSLRTRELNIPEGETLITVPKEL